LTQLLQAKRRPKLGAAVADAASQRQKHPGIPEAGAYVGRVQPSSPAGRAGLQVGDVITALGGQPIVRAADLDRLLPQMPRGRDVSITYVRNGQTYRSQVRL
jgi:S1-C subfamily serine protease